MSSVSSSNHLSPRRRCRKGGLCRKGAFTGKAIAPPPARQKLLAPCLLLPVAIPTTGKPHLAVPDPRRYGGVDLLRARVPPLRLHKPAQIKVPIIVNCFLIKTYVKSNYSDRTCLKISFLTQRKGGPRQRRRPERWFHWHHVRGGFIGARHGPSDLIIPLPRRPFHFAAPGRGPRYDYHPRAHFFCVMIIIPPPQTSAPQRARPSRLRETRRASWQHVELA